MDTTRRGSIVVGIILIALGVLFLLFSLLPGMYVEVVWPVIFYIIAAAFIAPAFLWPQNRRGLAALFIPGMVFLSLGLIFTYTVATNDWVAWAYAWLLLISGVGLGMLLAASYGGWDRNAFWAGIWMLAISAGLFGLFATLFGTVLLKTIGAILIIVIGGVLLLRAARR
jgi:hypothetical protein